MGRAPGGDADRCARQHHRASAAPLPTSPVYYKRVLLWHLQLALLAVRVEGFCVSGRGQDCGPRTVFFWSIPVQCID